MARVKHGLPGIYNASPLSLSDGEGAALALTQEGYVRVNIQNNVGITAPGDVVNGQKTITTGGTAEALASSTTVQSVTIKALAGNSGNVYVGDSSVSSSNGFVLVAGDAVSLDIDDLADVYLDVDTNGEGVSFIAVQ